MADLSVDCSEYLKRRGKGGINLPPQDLVRLVTSDALKVSDPAAALRIGDLDRLVDAEVLRLGRTLAVSIPGEDDFIHGQSYTLTGSGFGTKPTQDAPYLWDDCSGTDVFDLWDEVYGINQPDPACDTQYQTVIRSVARAHSRGTKYITHGRNNSSISFDATGALCKGFTTSSGLRTYLSHYYRIDPLWDWSAGAANLKTFAWGESEATYATTYWYNNYAEPELASRYWKTDAMPGVQSGYTPWYADAHYIVADPSIDPRTTWVKFEYECYWRTDGSGVTRFWESGNRRFDCTGQNDWSPQGYRSIMVGGYGRPYPDADNWDYMQDIYLDNSWCRVMLGNNTTLATSTVREPQIITSWADGSISFTVNAGAIADSATAYLHVVTADGTVLNNVETVTVG